MAPFVLVPLACLGLVLLHRLCLWAEGRGWIFYLHRKPSGHALGAVTLELQRIFESGKARHVIEATQDAKAESPDPGAGPAEAGDAGRLRAAQRDRDPSPGHSPPEAP